MNALLYLSVVLIWGTTWLVITLQQGAASVTVAIFWRFLIATVTLMVILVLLKRLKRLAWKDHFYCLLQGCCVFGFNFVCFYHASAFIASGLESVIFSMAVLFNALNGWLFFRIKPPVSLLPASLLGFGGVIALFWHDLAATQLSPALLTGIGLSLLGTFGFSLGNMLTQRHQRQGLDVLSTNAWAMGYGTLVMALISLFKGDNFMPDLTLTWTVALLWLAIPGSVIAFGAYFSLVGRIGAAKAAYSTLLFPLVALALSTWWENYVWHSNAVIGLLMILSGNLVFWLVRPQAKTQDKLQKTGQAT
ncbi:EamA family transporter [Enterobacterales bacterium CwR94]|nr:EamA family transporter [Enterobacterales bacterium CwR94]